MFNTNIESIVPESFDAFLDSLHTPLTLIITILDVIIVIFFIYEAYKLLRGTRALQLVKGI